MSGERPVVCGSPLLDPPVSPWVAPPVPLPVVSAALVGSGPEGSALVAPVGLTVPPPLLLSTSPVLPAAGSPQAQPRVRRKQSGERRDIGMRHLAHDSA